MTLEKDARGFTIYSKFKDTYDADVMVKHSSNVMDSRVWVYINGGQVSSNDGAALLDVEQAKRLREALNIFITKEESVQVKGHKSYYDVERLFAEVIAVEGGGSRMDDPDDRNKLAYHVAKYLEKEFDVFSSTTASAVNRHTVGIMLYTVLGSYTSYVIDDRQKVLHLAKVLATAVWENYSLSYPKVK